MLDAARPMTGVQVAFVVEAALVKASQHTSGEMQQQVVNEPNRRWRGSLLHLHNGFPACPSGGIQRQLSRVRISCSEAYWVWFRFL